jgi:TonB family protein
MNNRLVNSDRIPYLLGTASYLRALARINLGRDRDARWDYDVAIHLRPELADADLSPYGEAASKLKEWHSRTEAAREESQRPNALVAKEGSNTSGASAGEGLVRPKKKQVTFFQPPPATRDACIEGPVTVLSIIDEQGYPTRPQVLSAPHSLLAFAALETVREWRFEPATLDGKPFETHYSLTLNADLPDCF